MNSVTVGEDYQRDPNAPLDADKGIASGRAPGMGGSSIPAGMASAGMGSIQSMAMASAEGHMNDGLPVQDNQAKSPFLNGAAG